MKKISIHDFKRSKLKKYYGASKNVYRASHLERVMQMQSDLKVLSHWSTLTRIVPFNEEFLLKKAIPAYNRTVKRYREKYPDIKEFHYFKIITQEDADKFIRQWETQ